jgi:hypothetical protein
MNAAKCVPDVEALRLQLQVPPFVLLFLSQGNQSLVLCIVRTSVLL